MDAHPPGSFPVNDSTSEPTSIQPKTLDELLRPEEGTGSGNATYKGHSYTDSGVGLTKAREADQVLPQGDTQVVSHDKDTVTEVKEHPDWRDIPQGARVYNTVTGHGSAEDEERHHGQTQEDDGAVVSHPTNGQDQNVSSTEQPSTLVTESGVNKGASAAPEEAKRQHVEEGLGGATVVASAGAGVYETKHADDDVNKDETSQSSEKKQSKLGALFHRNSKSKDEAEESQNTQEPEEKKRNPLSGLFHRGDKKVDSTPQSDDKAPARDDTVVANKTSAYQTAHPELEQKPASDHSKAEEVAVASPGVGAAGAAAVAYEREHKADDLAPVPGARAGDSTLHSSSVPASSATEPENPAKVHNKEVIDAANSGQYNMLDSGTPSGVKVESERHIQPASHTEEAATGIAPATSDAGIDLGTKQGSLPPDNAHQFPQVAEEKNALADRPVESSHEMRSDNDQQLPEQTALADKPVQSSHEMQPDLGAGEPPVDSNAAASNLPAISETSTSPQKVTHICHSCGAENDISKYFS